MKVPVVYILHAHSGIGKKKARHYVGYVTDYEKLGPRIERHKKGRGGKIVAAWVRKGIDFDLVRVMEGGEILERRLKQAKNTKFYCPICNPNAMNRTLNRGLKKSNLEVMEKYWSKYPDLKHWTANRGHEKAWRNHIINHTSPNSSEDEEGATG